MSSLKDLPTLGGGAGAAAGSRRMSGFDLDPSIFDTDEPAPNKPKAKKKDGGFGGGNQFWCCDDFVPLSSSTID